MSLRILHTVEFYAPSVGGAQEVVRQLSERLASRGHDVSVATSGGSGPRVRTLEGVKVHAFDVHGNDARGITGDVDAYRRFVLSGDFDVVMTYAAQQWTTDALLPILDQIPGVRILAPCGFSGLHQSGYADYFAKLSEDLHRFDALIFHSDSYQDIVFARDAGIVDPVVISNAADEREFDSLAATGAFRGAHRIERNRAMLLTVGGHTGLKGHAQAMSALRASRHARRASLVIIGNRPTGRGCLASCRIRAAGTRVRRPGSQIRLLNPPRHQVLEAYAEADLFVFCSMIECSPLVLFEAMAAGLPFVTTDVGNAREIAEWSQAGVVISSARRGDGFVTPDPLALAEAVDELLEDVERRRDMAAAGRQAWRDRFTWEVVTSQYEALYEGLAA